MRTWRYLPYHFRGTLLPALAFIALFSSLKAMAMEIQLKSNDGITIPINQSKTNMQMPLVQRNTLSSEHQSDNALTITIPYNERIANEFVSLLDKSVFEPENPVTKHKELDKKIEQLPLSKYKWVIFIAQDGQHIPMSYHLAQWSNFVQGQIETFGELKEDIIIDFSLPDRPNFTADILQTCIKLFNKTDESSQKINDPFYEFYRNIQPIESLLEKKTLKDLIDIINCLDALGLVCDFDNGKGKNNIRALCLMSQVQKTIIEQLASIKDTTEQTDSIQYTKNHLNPNILYDMALRYNDWDGMTWSQPHRRWRLRNKPQHSFKDVILMSYVGFQNQDQEFFDKYFSIGQDLFAGLLTPQNNSWSSYFNFKNSLQSIYHSLSKKLSDYRVECFFGIMTAISIAAVYKLHAR